MIDIITDRCATIGSFPHIGRPRDEDFGPAPRGLVTPLATQAFHLGPFFLNQARTAACLVALLVAAGLSLVLQRTDLGKALRAAADEPEAALYMGIDVTRAHHIAFGLGTAIAGIAGGLIVIYYPAQPYVGKHAFAHKAGLHAAGVSADTRAFEHVDPAVVGNDRDVLISELAGRQSIQAKAAQAGIATDGELYGHHKKGRELFLRHLLDVAAPARGYVITGLGDYLAEHAPVRTMEVREATSWSCER